MPRKCVATNILRAARCGAWSTRMQAQDCGEGYMVEAREIRTPNLVIWSQKAASNILRAARCGAWSTRMQAQDCGEGYMVEAREI